MPTVLPDILSAELAADKKPQNQEISMAVQKSRRTPSTRGMRRGHDKLKKPTLAIDKTTGETHRRHHISADGFYRGERVVEMKVEAEEQE